MKYFFNFFCIFSSSEDLRKKQFAQMHFLNLDFFEDFTLYFWNCKNKTFPIFAQHFCCITRNQGEWFRYKKSLWCFQNDFFSWTECSCENVHSLKPLDNKQFLHFNFNCWFGFVATQKVEMWNQLHLCSKQKSFSDLFRFWNFFMIECSISWSYDSCHCQFSSTSITP